MLKFIKIVCLLIPIRDKKERKKKKKISKTVIIKQKKTSKFLIINITTIAIKPTITITLLYKF